MNVISIKDFNSVLEEANAITQIMLQNPASVIGVITPNVSLLKIIALKLTVYNKKYYADIRLTEANEEIFFKLILELIVSKLDSVIMLAFLKSSFIKFQFAKFKIEAKQYSKILEEFEINHTKNIANNVKNTKELQNILDEINKSLKILNSYFTNPKIKVKKILQEHIAVANYISNKSWQNNNNIKQFIENAKKIIDIDISPHNYKKAIENYLKHAEVQNSFANIKLLTKYKSFIEFDTIIIANFNKEIWENKPMYNYKNIKKILQNKNIIITKNNKNKECIFLHKIKQEYKVQKIQCPKNEISKTNNLFCNLQIKKDFPKYISSKDLTLLVENPYGFYVKNIMNIKQMPEINNRPQKKDLYLAIKRFFSSGREINNKNLSSYLDKYFVFYKYHPEINTVWRQKFINIIDWMQKEDLQIKPENNATILYNQKTETIFKVGEKNINIYSICNIIKINDNKATLINYTTRAQPTILEMQQGISAELLISAMAAEEKTVTGNNLQIVELKNINLIEKKQYKFNAEKSQKLITEFKKNVQIYLELINKNNYVFLSSQKKGRYIAYRHMAHNEKLIK